MNHRCLTLPANFFVAVLCCASFCAAQNKSPSPSPNPTPPTGESPDKVKIFTEEVVIPVSAYDDSGHLSVALEPQAIMVFEDDVRQTVRSISRVPANVLLLLDTGGALNPAMSVSTTKEIATRLISTLRTGDRVTAIQFGNHLESISLIKALFAAAARLQEVPAGTRHLVLITDGVDASGDAAELTRAIKQLLDANVTIHVIGYGALGRKKIDKEHPLVKITNKKRRNAGEIAEDLMDPAGAARREVERRKKIYVIFDTDSAMRKKHNAYEQATKQSELWLRSLAEETGGLAFIPQHLQEMSARADEIAREIDSQYVVTYTPKRPLAEATAEEYRRLDVAAGVIGLHVRARRGYVARGR